VDVRALLVEVRLAPGPAQPRLEPDEVASKLIAGMRRNAQAGARITGGEPAMYWEHTRSIGPAAASA
jgi:uncharacterized Fe-S cluster-containing radical SAM superfamily protein